MPALAPTIDILDSYKKKKIDWNDYENKFNKLITQRNIEKKFTAEELNNACLLCSEHTADQCHRTACRRVFTKRNTKQYK